MRSSPGLFIFLLVLPKLPSFLAQDIDILYKHTTSFDFAGVNKRNLPLNFGNRDLSTAHQPQVAGPSDISLQAELR